MSTNPIEQTAGLPLRTQLSVSEVQAFLEASLDPAPMTFSQLINQQLALPVAASHLIFGFFLLCLADLLLLACQFGFGGWRAVGYEQPKTFKTSATCRSNLR